MKKAKDVDSYIAAAPKKVQRQLKALRSAIKAAVPAATEKISYGMPYYGYKGRVAYFGLAKAHIGLYIPTPVLEEHKSEIGRYYASKATVHLPLEKKLPVALIKKLVRARVKKNDAGK